MNHFHPGATRKEFPDHGRQLRDKWPGRGDQGPVHQLEAAHLLDRGQPGHRDLHCACSRLLTGAIWQDGKTFQTYKKNLFSNSPRLFKLLEVVTTSQPPAWLSRSDLNVQIQRPISEKCWIVNFIGQASLRVDLVESHLNCLLLTVTKRS